MPFRVMHMSDSDFEGWVRRTAQEFEYPPTPERSPERGQAPVRRRPRLAWGLLLVLILLAAGLFAVPQARAQILEFLQLGVVRIWQVQPTPTPPPTAAPGSLSGTPVTATPAPIDLVSILELAGETSLEEARASLDFPLRLPAYPPDLGAPQRVFVQELGGPLLVLVWVDSDMPERVVLSLHAYGPGTFAEKFKPQEVQEAQVNGERALWMAGPYLIKVRNGNYEASRLIDGHVLIWTIDDITYRLETSLSLEEAVRIAESVR